jgi:hypothetical protein
MRFRKLRIAFSATCLIACVLLIGLWVRSYWILDFVHRQSTKLIQTTIGSEVGKIYLAHFDAAVGYKDHPHFISGPHGWNFVSRPPVADPNSPHFMWKQDAAGVYLSLSHWSVAVFAALIGGSIWLPCRFSLRTLLIATTLVAAMLGLIVAVLRWPAG